MPQVNTRSKPLTDLKIRSAKAKARPYKLKDSRGLYIEIRPTGAKLWRWRYRFGGKETMLSLGEHPETGIAAAREARDAARRLVKQGIHPALKRKLEAIQRQYEGANTFAAVAREWIEQNASHWAAGTKTQRERLLEREVFPTIGGLPINQVTPAHVLAILKRLAKEAPSFAVLAQQAIGATFRLAVSTLRADADPVAPLRGSIKTPPTQHKTPLDAKDIPGFFKALEAYSGAFQTKAAIRLVWLTLARTNEALQAKWTEFDLEAGVWKIPGKRTKGRTVAPHVFPLPTQAVELLRRLSGVTGASEYLFPNRSTNRKPAAVTLLNKAVSAMGYAGKFSPHAIRNTGSTMLNEMGFNGDWIERQLAHKDRNETRASYNGAKYLEQRREMMQTWADHIEALCAGVKVTPIRKAGGFSDRHAITGKRQSNDDPRQA